MERNYQNQTAHFIDSDELNWRTAFHEAGHATAIHLGNQQRQLPPVFFEILIKKPKSPEDQFFAKVLDGNLIQNLPISVVESFSMMSGNGQHSCQRAYEADVINLLVGPLAEAKYVSIRDNEVFNLAMINARTLHFYGGFTDLEIVKNYLDSFIADKELREAKFLELVSEAFSFINDHRNWCCIINLAQHILNSGQESICCDEAINILDNCLEAYPKLLNLDQ